MQQIRSILLQILRVSKAELFITAPDAFYWRLVADAIQCGMAADLIRLLPVYAVHRLTDEMVNTLVTALSPQDAAHLLAFTGERKLRLLGAQHLDRLVEEASRTSKTALLPLLVDSSGLLALNDAQVGRLVNALSARDWRIVQQQAAPPVIARINRCV